MYKLILNFLVLILVSFATPLFAETKPYDLIFIDEMTPHHKEGVEMANLAVTKASHAELREMAKMMAKEQQMEINLMQTWRKDWYGDYPYMHHGVGMNMQKLMALSGKEFDLAFLDSMIAHHPGAIYLGYEVQKRGEHSPLIMLGKKIAEKQTMELNKLRMWRYYWFPGH